MIVEIVTKSGRVMEVHAFQKNHLTIGRGYGNDLILQDPYMEADHLKVQYCDEQNQFLVTDLDSVNGTKAHGRAAQEFKNDTVALPLGQVLTLGKTNIRLRDRRYAIPAALRLSSFEPLFSKLSSLWVTFFSVGAAVVITLLSAYLKNPFSEKLLKELNSVIMLVLVAIAYGGLWMLVARLQRSEGRFLFNVNLLLIMLMIDGLLQLGMAGYDFNLSWILSTTMFSIAATFLLVSIVLFISCTQTLSLNKWAATAIAVTLGFLPIMSDVSAILFPADFNSRPSYNMTLVPPAYQLRSGSSEGAFLQLVEEAYQPYEEGE